MLFSSRAVGDNYNDKSFKICKYEIIALKTVSKQHAKKKNDVHYVLSTHVLLYLVFFLARHYDGFIIKSLESKSM